MNLTLNITVQPGLAPRIEALSAPLVETRPDVPGALTWSPTLDCGEVNHHDALKAVEKLNAAQFQGFADWRLPEIRELLSLVDYTRTKPAIDTTRFPDTKSDWYWTNTLYAGDPAYAWFVSFGNGLSGSYHRGDLSGFVRAVRGPVARPGQ